MENFVIGLAFIVFIVIPVIIIIKRLQKKSEEAESFLTTIFFNESLIKGKITMLELQSTQFVLGSLQPVNVNNDPAPIQPGTVNMGSSELGVCIVEKDINNELNFKVTATGVGTSVLDFTAVNAKGNSIRTTLDVTVTESLEAVGFLITLGEPQEQ